MERDAWNKQNRQKRFQGMGFPVKKPNEYACIVLKSLFCTISWYLFLSVQLSVQNFPTESCIAAIADVSAGHRQSPQRMKIHFVWHFFQRCGMVRYFRSLPLQYN